CRQAGRLADRAVDVSDDAARPAHNVVMIVADAPLEPRRAAGGLDAADELGRGERVQGVIDGLQGDMTETVAHLRGDGLDAEMVAGPDGLEQRDAGRRYPQAGTAQLLRRGLRPGFGHDDNLPS